MHLEHLEYFVETVNQKSINKAAKNLYISQPTLSLAIAKMEETVGAKLIYRTKKGVFPTMRGQQVYKDALDIIAGTNSVLKKWQDDVQEDNKIEGDVSVLTIPSASGIISHFAIQELREIAPKINLYMQEEHLHENITILTTSNINIGIGSYTMSRQEEALANVPANGWHIEQLFSDQMSVHISSRHPYSKKSYLTIEDCAELPLAYYRQSDQEYTPSFLHLFDTSKSIKTNSKENIMHMIVENVAVSVFPYKITQHDFYRRNNYISAVLFDKNIALDNIMYYIIYRDNLSQAEQKVVDVIRFCAKTYFN